MKEEKATADNCVKILEVQEPVHKEKEKTETAPKLQPQNRVENNRNLIKSQLKEMYRAHEKMERLQSQLSLSLYSLRQVKKVCFKALERVDQNLVKDWHNSSEVSELLQPTPTEQPESRTKAAQTPSRTRFKQRLNRKEKQTCESSNKFARVPAEENISVAGIQSHRYGLRSRGPGNAQVAQTEAAGTPDGNSDEKAGTETTGKKRTEHNTPKPSEVTGTTSSATAGTQVDENPTEPQKKKLKKAKKPRKTKKLKKEEEEEEAEFKAFLKAEEDTVGAN